MLEQVRHPWKAVHTVSSLETLSEAYGMVRSTHQFRMKEFSPGFVGQSRAGVVLRSKIAPSLFTLLLSAPPMLL